METTINLQTLKIDDIFTFHSAEEQNWMLCRVKSLGVNFITLEALEGTTIGWIWNENIQNIQDPELYRPYIPKPPKRKRFRLIKHLFYKN